MQPVKPNLTQLSTRYLPFLVVAAVLALLVAVTPSSGSRTTTVAGGAEDFSGEGFGAGGGEDTDGWSGEGSSSAEGVTDPAGAAPAATPGAGNGSGGAGGVAGSGGGGGGDTAGAPGVAEDRSNCDEHGMQRGPVYELGVTCRPVHTGDNGGTTMQGVTAEEWRYVWYNPPENPVINGLLAGAGFAREPGPFCDHMVAFEQSSQKYYEMSGRRLVSLDGPGNQAGSRTCGGRYRFFQSQCPNTHLDTACMRADGRVIAEQLQPAAVLAPRGVPVLFEELGRRGTLVVGAGGTRERFQEFAPYLWGTGLSGERTFGLHSEYYCKRLVGQDPEFGGADVQALPHPRRAAMIYPDTGDGAMEPLIDLWLRTVRGCGDTHAKAYSYEVDVARAQQQASSIVAQMRADGITTVSWCCDPVSNVFLLQALEQNRYYPEHLVLPVSSIASDAAGYSYEDLGLGSQWQHAFGISNFPVNQDDRTLEYRKVYADGGGPGGMQGAKAIEIESWGVFKPMMQMIHNGGPRPTPRSIFEGMQAMPAVQPSKWTPGFDYAPPDPFVPQRDVAEVWWNPNLYSYYGDRNGAMCYVNDARRYSLGEIPSGRPDLFTGGNDACARLD